MRSTSRFNIRLTLSISAVCFSQLAVADILQYNDCDEDGSLILDSQDPMPSIDLSFRYLGCADLVGQDLTGSNFEGSDLRCARLAGAVIRDANFNGTGFGVCSTLGADFSGSSFEGADLYFTAIGGANLTGTSFRNTFLHVTLLAGAQAAEADFTGALIKAARLDGGNFADSIWDGSTWRQMSFLPGVNLSSASLRGASFEQARFSQSSILDDANFSGSSFTQFEVEESSLRGAIFDDGRSDPDARPSFVIDGNARGASFKRFQFVGRDTLKGDFTGAIFDETYLPTRVIADGIVLIGASFNKAVIEHPDDEGFRLDLSVPGGMALQGPSFSGATLISVWVDADATAADFSYAATLGPVRRISGALLDSKFTKANLTGAELGGIDAVGSNFDETGLVNANLGNIRLRDASLRGADLRSARLEFARGWRSADVTGARYNASTELPSELDPAAEGMILWDCPADMNVDGSLNIDDVLLFLGYFDEGHPYADIVRSDRSVYDIDDVLAFLTHFIAGCPD